VIGEKIVWIALVTMLNGATTGSVTGSTVDSTGAGIVTTASATENLKYF
jgi:hypothetical protein